MALNAFLHAQGTVVGFESVAEGLLELLDLAKEVRASADNAVGGRRNPTIVSLSAHCGAAGHSSHRIRRQHRPGGC